VPATTRFVAAGPTSSARADFSSATAVQIHGGYGYTRECPVERMHGDSKIYDIFEGTEQIQQLLIARAISGLRIE